MALPDLEKHIHLIGIGGIGMSALAQYYLTTGAHLTGSDREASPTTEMLVKKGISVAIGQKAEQVPADANLVVYSAAVPPDNPERVRGLRRAGIATAREYSWSRVIERALLPRI